MSHLRRTHIQWTIFMAAFTVFSAANAAGAELTLDEHAARPGEWGYRPGQGDISQVDPPAFSWRPQKGLSWEIQVAKESDFERLIYHTQGIAFNVHCPTKPFGSGSYCWRYRGADTNGKHTNWSESRRFEIANDAAKMPMPKREELLDRIPDGHPRLFTRPEKVAHLRTLARGRMQKQYDDLVRECERLLKDPPPTKEPPKYPAGIKRGSDPWREIWWGNRRYTIKALNGAATLAFTHLLGGPEKYGAEARRILLECAKWDPKGSTGYRYNDEAGMPYAYYFSRTYTFANALLSEDEKKLCRNVMQVRGQEMYNHLYPRHLWRPYSSHSNRAWHFLGEVGIAFLGEVEGAEDWIWFAANVFFNVYPVWSDADGGWHEGASYWSSYISRFTWWADVMREAMGIDAYQKPYFSKAGYYAMYLMPPDKVGGGFGDLCARRTARSNVSLMTTLAAQAGTSHWQWYVEAIGGPNPADGYVGFIRGALPEVEPKAPTDISASRLFGGIGQAYLNTTIFDADEDVQVVFKASPFGTQSHGYEANNSFLLWAYGQRLLIRSGYRDSYGSDHHRNWMWSTRSVNNITVNGNGQGRRTAEARGHITAFKTTPEIDVVSGRAGDAYEPPLEAFERTIIFIKPELVVVYDRLRVKEPSTFTYWLHALNRFDVENQHRIRATSDDVVCDIDFLAPAELAFEQTNQYDPNPRPRIKLREWHLTATTTGRKRDMEFVTLYRLHREKDEVPHEAALVKANGGYVLRAQVRNGRATALLPSSDQIAMAAAGLNTHGGIACRLERKGEPDVVVQTGP